MVEPESQELSTNKGSVMSEVPKQFLKLYLLDKRLDVDMSMMK